MVSGHYQRNRAKASLHAPQHVSEAKKRVRAARTKADKDIQTMRQELTLDNLLDQLEHARQIAIEDRKPTAMIQATITTAKLLGFDQPVVKDANADAVQSISDLMNELADDEDEYPQLTARIEHVKDD